MTFDLFSHPIPVCSIVLKSEQQSAPSIASSYGPYLRITPALENYLKGRQSIRGSQQGYNKQGWSDWDYLREAAQAPSSYENREILDFFARDSTYQLCFEKPEIKADTFIEHPHNLSLSLIPILAHNLKQSINNQRQVTKDSLTCFEEDACSFLDRQSYSSLAYYSCRPDKDPTADVETIRNILQNGILDNRLFSPRPDQFKSGAIYTFRMKIQGETHQILAKVLSNQVEFHLMRLPNFSNEYNQPSFQLIQPAQILLIRHAEKPAEKKDPHLSELGKKRAEALVDVFTKDPAFLEFGPPIAIYAQAIRNDRPADNPSSERPIETVIPLAKKLGLNLITNYLHEKYKEMIDEIKTNPAYHGKSVLISWGHKVLGEMAHYMGATEAPKEWPKSFERVWKIKFLSDGKVAFEDLSQNLNL